MLDEVAEALAVEPGGRYVDATVGEGGHAQRILELGGPDSQLLALDRDGDALESARRHLAGFGSRVRFRHASFDRLPELLAEIGWHGGCDGVLVDLGVSSLQLDLSERGFSFSADGPLDMRMDRSQSRSAAELIASASEEELADILYRYGEERASRRIARQVVQRSARGELRTTADLRAAVRAAGVKGRPGHDPATRSFQALRIAVNDELGQIERLLEAGWQCLRPATSNPGGRMVILSYHSLEDRLVKQAFRRWASDCLCPPRQPVCDCGWYARVRLVTRRKRKPGEAEVLANPRARSAGLRVVERLES